MSWYDSGWIAHKHYGVSYSWRCTCTTSRPSYDSVRFVGELQERQNGTQYNYDAHNASIDYLLSYGQVKGGGNIGSGGIRSRSFDVTLSGFGSGGGTYTTYGRISGGGNSYTDTYYIPYESSCVPTAPTMTITGKRATTDTVSVDLRLDSWGEECGDSDGRRYIEAMLYDSPSDRGSNHRWADLADNETSGTVTITNSSSIVGNLTITPNTKYYIWKWATNKATTLDGAYDSPVYTIPSAPTISSIQVLGPTQGSFVINQATGGGAYPITTSYRFRSDNTDWSEYVTASAGSTVKFDAESGTNYRIQTKATTEAGENVGSEYTLSTPAVTTTLNSTKLDLNQQDKDYNALFNISLTAISTPEDKYDVQVVYKKNSSGQAYKTVSYVLSSPNEVLRLPNLAIGTNYCGYIRSRIKGESDEHWGNKVDFEFTTPAPFPVQPTLMIEFDELRRVATVRIHCAYLGEGATFKASEVDYSYDNFKSVFHTSDTVRYPKVRYTMKFFKPNATLYMRARAQNSADLWSDYEYLTVTVPRPIWGLMKMADGTTRKIVDIRIKDKNGKLSPRDWIDGLSHNGGTGSTRVVKIQ